MHNVWNCLNDKGIFIGETMCNTIPENIQEKFEVGNGLLIKNGIAGRYIGKAQSIIDEIKNAGFRMIYHKVMAASDNESDTLFYVAQKR